MYNNNSNVIHKINTEKSAKYQVSGSVLDNIGTFRQFCDTSATNFRHKKDFYTLYYRRKNLLLKHKLENTSQKSNDIIQKVCKNLACCSSLSEVKNYEDTEVHISKTSKKCKSRYCLICSRIESNKNTMKFIDKATSEEHAPFFQPRYFYFLTLTVRHNEETRQGNYLKDFRKNILQLTRSKIYKDTFIQSKDKNNYGAIQSIEMTISKDTYHIHSHSLICSLPIKEKINTLQENLRSAWSKITGDSDQIRIDLIKYNPEDNHDDPEDNGTESLIRSASEVFKYVVKSSSLNALKPDQMEMLADWMIATKGKNFINALGYFRKLGIVRRVKKDETGESAPNENPIKEVLLTKTININSNANLNLNYSKSARQQVLKYFKITAITDLFTDVTEIQDQVKDILKSFKNDEIIDTFMTAEVKEIKHKNKIWDDMQNEDLFSHHFNKRAAQDMNQMYHPDAPF